MRTISGQTALASEDRLLRVPDVVQILGYSRATVYRLVGAGQLPVVKVAGTIRFRYLSILQWMADHETPVASRIPTETAR